MFYALKVGPIESGEGQANAYLGFDDETGLLRPPVVDRDDEAGLGQLLAGAPPGSALRCEPRLAQAGGRLGFEPAPLPEDVIPVRATLALRFSLGTSSKDIRNPDVLFELAVAAAAFVRAAPWNHWNDESLLEVAFSGPVSGRFKGSILGRGDETYGLALQHAARSSSLAVRLDHGPRYAVEALDAAFGLRAVPIPMRTQFGAVVPPREADLVALAAALRAVAQLSPTTPDARGKAEVGTIRVAARVHAPAAVVEEPAAAASESAGSVVHHRDERLVSDLMEYAAQHRIARRWNEATASGYRVRVERDPGQLQLFVPWSVYECRVDGHTVLDWYLRERDRQLSAEDRGWLEAQSRSWLSAWEVQAVDPGVNVVVQDLLTGEMRTVTEAMGSRTLAARDALLARVVDHGNQAVFCGCHPRRLGPMDADAVVSHARRRLRVRSGRVPVARLKEPGATEMLIAKWDGVVKTLVRRPPRRLSNTDGDPILSTTDHFTLAPRSRAKVEARIAAMGHVEGPEHHGGVAHFTVLRPGNRLHRSWENTVVGSIEVSTNVLKVQGNSVRRTDDLRRAVEAACAGLLAHRIREHSNPAPIERDPLPGPPELPPTAAEEAACTLREIKRRMYADWMDEPIPMLGGVTPRQATRMTRRRHKLDVLLKDIENRESRLPLRERMDVSVLRAELGLSEGD